MAAYARRVLGESETSGKSLHERSEGMTGQLRIGMIDAAALYLFTDSIADFTETHPNVSLTITVAGSAVLEQRLADFRDDVVIVVGPPARGVATHLRTEPMHLYGSNAAADDSTLALYPTGSRTRTAIDTGLATAGITGTVVAESGNPAVLRELSRLTGSRTVLPELVAATGGALPMVSTDIAQREIHALTREQSADRSLVAALLAKLVT